jgi:hypothetical protein
VRAAPVQGMTSKKFGRLFVPAPVAAAGAYYSKCQGSWVQQLWNDSRPILQILTHNCGGRIGWPPQSRPAPPPIVEIRETLYLKSSL